MFKKLLTVITLCAGMQSADGAVPEFTDAEWASNPAPGNIRVEEVIELFAGPLEKNSRKWTLASRRRV
jgi:hypothetical protein